MKKQKITTGVLTAVATLSLMAIPVAAQTVTLPPTTATNPAAVNRLAQQATRTTDRTADLKTRADAEITRRSASLNKLISRINSMKRITADQKTTLTSQVQTEITNLNALKAKIDADTDITTLRTDVQSIVQSYRVFVVFMPKIEIIAAADRLGDASDQMNTIVGKLQVRIQQAQTSGKDVTALQTALSDMQAKIADAKTESTTVIAAVINATPADYPGIVASFQTNRKLLQTGRTDLRTAGADARTIIQGLKAFRGTSQLVSPTAAAQSATPTAPQL